MNQDIFVIISAHRRGGRDGAAAACPLAGGCAGQGRPRFQPEEHRRPGNAPAPVPGQGAAAGQHGEQVRLHPAIQGAGRDLQALQGPGAGHPRLPGQQFLGQEPGTRPADQGILPDQLRGQLPHVLQDIGARQETSIPCTNSWSTRRPTRNFAGKITWNFTKFLVDRRGSVVARFEPKRSPTTRP